MKVYQLKLCVRGNPAAMQTVLVEAAHYKEAIVKSIEKLAKMNNIAVEELAVQDIKVIEDAKVTFNFSGDVKTVNLDMKDAPVPDEKPVAESIDILRLDESHKNREIVGEEKK